MLNQSELNFYGYNTKNIIKRENRGKITVVLRYDSGYNNYIIERKTPKTSITERTKDINEAKELYNAFLYKTWERLTNSIRNCGTYTKG